MAVITISRELGSEGDQIAELLCRELGYNRVDKDILGQIAQEAGVNIEAVLAKEQNVTSRPKLVSTEMTSLYNKEPGAFKKKSVLDDKTYNRILRETMTRFAQEGEAIIVGRGGQMILHDWPAVLHVRLYASLETRIQALKQRQGLSEQAAKQQITRSDEQKRQYIRHMHKNADWTKLKYYHLCIDTSHIAPEVAAQMIILAAQHKTI